MIRNAMQLAHSSDGSLADQFWSRMHSSVRDQALAPQLQAAADGARFGPWTELVTEALVRTCRSLGWTCSAKVAGAKPLPVERQEYLGIDVLAFPSRAGWRYPIAAIELENSRRRDLIAYALWKVCTVRAQLAVLVCYQYEAVEVASLAAGLEEQVLRPLAPEVETLVIVGTRGSAGTYPDGYFQRLIWDRQLGQLVSGARALRVSKGTVKQ